MSSGGRMGGGADAMHQLDGRAHVGETEAAAGQRLLIHAGVQIGEALGEFHLFAVDR